MNCREFEINVLAVASDELVEDAVLERSLAHVRVCSRCSNRLTEERALIRYVRAVAADIDSHGAPARIEAALLTAFHDQFDTASPARVPAGVPARVVALPTAKPMSTRRWPVLKLAAVAASILILALVTAVIWQQKTSVNTRQNDYTEVLNPLPETPSKLPPLPDQSVPAPPEVAKNEGPRPRRPGRHRAAEETPEEVVTEFFVLVDGRTLELLDSLHVIRVELPSSALLTVGLPVDVHASDEPVTADVVLGQDGLARAIRFVR